MLLCYYLNKKMPSDIFLERQADYLLDANSGWKENEDGVEFTDLESKLRYENTPFPFLNIKT